ncbi:MAG TPA: carbamoyltransferase C-terminal domain-containing protein [Candidatus Omnitrophota bacterium]|nr:carbamoyltransferase C-terminal domain-containing protein [Candidatus Omnitrophota bacterium]HRZ15178.1 carbamoyltransferase C-terminal domain-containing protein [Candidatus Omnitrophota bacterium]
MKILGLAAPFGHDHSAAILVDGKVIAGAEEERFTRKKHADGQMPVNAVKFCLDAAGLKPSDIDCVAFPWSFHALRDHRVEYLLRTMFTRPSRAFKKFFRNRRELRGEIKHIFGTLEQCGFDPLKVKLEWVEHHLAHAASAFYFSGMERAAVMSIDAGGELASTLLGTAAGKDIRKLKEILAPDSLGDFYATMTDYLGFERGDGEYKVMGMAPFGDPVKSDLSRLIRWDAARKTYHCSDAYVWVQRSKRFRVDKVYSRRMVREFGPERTGDGLSEPYIHIAAATQKSLEDITLRLIEAYLKPELEMHGNLCFAGGVALNVAMNRILLEQPYIKHLWVQPASGDAGGSLGAAAYAGVRLGERIAPMRHAYLGPEFAAWEIEQALSTCGYEYHLEKNICLKAATLLQQGEIVGWFQGRMEWGPRALGNRSILGNPTIRGTADRINEIIKFRENWRPFCPSLLKEFAPDILQSNHPAPFMTIAFKAALKWKERIPEVVHVDGTCRPQIVEKETNPRFYQLIQDFHRLSGVPVVINTSLNRRGEPMICSPRDALLMFKESGLDYLAMGDYLVSKK